MQLLRLCLVAGIASTSTAAGIHLKECTPGDDELWQYTNMAFLQHASTGVTLVALGDESSSAEVGVTSTPQLLQAQWMFNESSHLIRAFRTSDRCLSATKDCTGVDVAACDSSDPLQLFPTFSPDFNPATGKSNAVRFGGCSGKCLELEAGSPQPPAPPPVRQTMTNCRLPNPYIASKQFNTTTMRANFDFTPLANKALNWTDPDYGYAWWQLSVCSNLEHPAPTVDGATCANALAPLPAAAVSGDIEQAGNCYVNAIWDESAVTKYRLFFDGTCGVSIEFNNGAVDPTYNVKRSVEYLLLCDPTAVEATVSDVEQPTKMHFAVTISTALACPYLANATGVDTGKPGCPPYLPGGEV